MPKKDRMDRKLKDKSAASRLDRQAERGRGREERGE